uniref:FHA domain-containing protein n=1 Tax=Steinernema glaseri TaxID=37863 RepID=A0A1I8ACI1_9BILA
MSSSGDSNSSQDELVTPLAILLPIQQSHPFEERRIPVHEGESEQIKIGRSVARWKANLNNAIFDCKVLSRNHAVLFYEEGCFYIRDTKSSNGTFINSERLSKSGEESAPRPIHSGDILQLGVEIIESSNKSHGCIMALVRLYNECGVEVINQHKVQRNNAEVPRTAERTYSSSADASFISPTQLFQMQQYIKEAMFREKNLEEKLQSVQTLLANTVKSSQDTWEALINEDRLLSRIEMLEGQLSLFSKNTTQDALRKEVFDMLEERNEYETKCKQVVQRLEEEKREAFLRISDLEKSLTNTENEINVLNIKHRDELEYAQRQTDLLREEVILLREANALNVEKDENRRNSSQEADNPTESSMTSNAIGLAQEAGSESGSRCVKHADSEEIIIITNGQDTGAHNLEDFARKSEALALQKFLPISYSDASEHGDHRTSSGYLNSREGEADEYLFLSDTGKSENTSQHKKSDELLNQGDFDAAVPNCSDDENDAVAPSCTHAMGDVPTSNESALADDVNDKDSAQMKVPCAEITQQGDRAHDGKQALVGDKKREEDAGQKAKCEEDALGYDVFPSMSYHEERQPSPPDYLASTFLLCSVAPLLGIMLMLLDAFLSLFTLRRQHTAKED